MNNDDKLQMLDDAQEILRDIMSKLMDCDALVFNLKNTGITGSLAEETDILDKMVDDAFGKTEDLIRWIDCVTDNMKQDEPEESEEDEDEDEEE